MADRRVKRVTFRGPDGHPVINEEEAKVVRQIYRLFLQGRTPVWIATHLTDLGVPTPAGAEQWRTNTIISILTNEKYKGDALLQKSYTVDFLTKKKKVNTGEIPQYYVQNSHPAIIEPIEFDMVQVEIARRKKLGRSYSGLHIFSSKLICEDCGGFYGQKVWHSTDAFRKYIWQCNSKFKGHSKCKTATLDAEVIKRMYLQAYNELMGNREQLLDDCEMMRATLMDTTALDETIAALEEEIKVVAEMVNGCVKENITSPKSHDEYVSKYNRLVKRYDTAVEQHKAAEEERNSKLERERELRVFIAMIKEKPMLLEEWSDDLWISLIESGTVHRDGSITFLFKNGASIHVTQ